MAEDDLKRISFDDWKNQIKSGAYIRLICYNLWGLILIGFLIYNYRLVIENGVDLVTVFILIVAFSYMFAGFYVFKTEMKKLVIES